MTRTSLFGITCGGILAFMLQAMPAHAQASRTWVSGVGDDANPCSRTAPCKTFAGAISKTAPFGEINCLDSGGFGSVTITKSITIKCEGVIGGILASGTFGVTVNALATDIVTLSGLDIEGFGTGTNGIRFLNGAALHVHKIQIRGFRQSGAGGNGIFVDGAGTKELHVANSYITDNGSNATTGGIVIKPTGSGTVLLTVNGTQVENNSEGIRADTSTTSGNIRGIVRDSMVAGNTNNGIATVSNATTSQLMVDKTSVVGNGVGLVVSGAPSILLVTHTSVTANGTGLLAVGGTLFSYRTNFVNGNTAADGAFTNFIVPQ